MLLVQDNIGKKPQYFWKTIFYFYICVCVYICVYVCMYIYTSCVSNHWLCPQVCGSVDQAGPRGDDMCLLHDDSASAGPAPLCPYARGLSTDCWLDSFVLFHILSAGSGMPKMAFSHMSNCSRVVETHQASSFLCRASLDGMLGLPHCTTLRIVELLEWQLVSRRVSLLRDTGKSWRSFMNQSETFQIVFSNSMLLIRGVWAS